MVLTAAAAGVGSAGDEVDGAVHQRRTEAVAGVGHGFVGLPGVGGGIVGLVFIEGALGRFPAEHENLSIHGLRGDAAPLGRERRERLPLACGRIVGFIEIEIVAEIDVDASAQRVEFSAQH